MIAFVLAGLLALQVEAPPLSAEARALIAPIEAAIEAEEARQAALPPPASDTERLIRMRTLDQVGRQVFSDVDFSRLPAEQRQAAEAAAWIKMNEVDKALLAELLTMVPPEGWFRKSVYGEQAAGAAFLIIQHSDAENWRRFVPVLERMAREGEVEGQHYGMMYDRLQINEGRPQRYGTQMTCKAGRWVVDDLEDRERADELRREMNIPGTLAQYEAHFATYPPCVG